MIDKRVTEDDFQKIKRDIKLACRDLFAGLFSVDRKVPSKKDFISYIFNLEIPCILGRIVSLTVAQKKEIEKISLLEYETIINDLYDKETDNLSLLRLYAVVKEKGKIVGYVFRVKNSKIEYVYKKLNTLNDYIKNVEDGKINSKGYLEIRGILMGNIKVENLKEVLCYCKNIEV